MTLYCCQPGCGRILAHLHVFRVPEYNDVCDIGAYCHECSLLNQVNEGVAILKKKAEEEAGGKFYGVGIRDVEDELKEKLDEVYEEKWQEFLTSNNLV